MIDLVRRDGLAFDVRDEGPRSGDVAVLLHGFPQDSRCWAEVAPVLHRGGLRTLAPDQRGYSPSARPADVSAYRVSTLAADALAVMDAAGVLVTLMMASPGSWITGSGTSSTRTSRFPCHTTARMSASRSRVTGAYPPGAG